MGLVVNVDGNGDDKQCNPKAKYIFYLLFGLISLDSRKLRRRKRKRTRTQPAKAIGKSRTQASQLASDHTRLWRK